LDFCEGQCLSKKQWRTQLIFQQSEFGDTKPKIQIEKNFSVGKSFLYPDKDAVAQTNVTRDRPANIQIVVTQIQIERNASVGQSFPYLVTDAVAQTNLRPREKII
jgi:hypothetical protein